MNTKISLEALRKAYVVMQDNCGIRVGDSVKVLRAAKSTENGWDAYWNSRGMDEFVGKTLVVGDINNNLGCYCYPDAEGRSSAFWYPFFILEVVKPAFVPRSIKINKNYMAEVHADHVKVGCQRFEFSAIKDLATAINAAQEYTKS